MKKSYCSMCKGRESWLVLEEKMFCTRCLLKEEPPDIKKYLSIFINHIDKVENFLPKEQLEKQGFIYLGSQKYKNIEECNGENTTTTIFREFQERFDDVILKLEKIESYATTYGFWAKEKPKKIVWKVGDVFNVCDEMVISYTGVVTAINHRTQKIKTSLCESWVTLEEANREYILIGNE